ncbi:hypothetical protein GCM10011319_25770 [Mameliella alba]|nr:hypothetical protein GCM10011319_25770 [Mameliella alba]
MVGGQVLGQDIGTARVRRQMLGKQGHGFEAACRGGNANNRFNIPGNAHDSIRNRPGLWHQGFSGAFLYP